MEARGQLVAGGAISARLDVAELGLKALLAEWSPGAADLIDGRVSAAGDLTIPIDHPETATGSIRIDPAALVLLGDPWASRGPIALRWQRGDLSLESVRLEGPAGTLTGSGVLGGASSAQLRARAGRRTPARRARAPGPRHRAREPAAAAPSWSSRGWRGSGRASADRDRADE